MTTVYKKIAAVAAELSILGIAKDQRNQAQGFQFRGIDDVMIALSPILAKHQLLILPRQLSRTVTEKPTKNGGLQFFVVIEAEFDFIDAENTALEGTIAHTVRMFGEGQDSADKGTAKAASAAYKSMVLQAFCIPTQGTPDADAGGEPAITEEQAHKQNDKSDFFEVIPTHNPATPWRNVICHIGKEIKGKPLGTLKPSELEYLIAEWHAKKTVNGFRSRDAFLEAALVAAKEEITDNIPMQ